MAEYELKLMQDVPEQFKRQPNIKVLLDAMAAQLDELATFYRDLLTARTIANAEGKQLDYIGDIVCLTRAEASAISATGDIMDDDMYRRYLLYKITLNTSTCTLQDIYEAIHAFSHDIALYREDVAHQATIILEMSDRLYELFSHFKFARAAGVQLDFEIFPTRFTLFGEDEDDGLKSFFSYFQVEKIPINGTIVYDSTLYLDQDYFYVIDS